MSGKRRSVRSGDLLQVDAEMGVFLVKSRTSEVSSNNFVVIPHGAIGIFLERSTSSDGNMEFYRVAFPGDIGWVSSGWLKLI